MGHQEVDRPLDPADDPDRADPADDAQWQAFVGIADADGEDERGGVSLEYELDHWAVESREMLRNLLLGAAVVHSWQGGRLVVPEEAEEQVDELIEQVELTTAPSLDPDADTVAFVVDDLDDPLIDELQRRLADAALPFAFDDEGQLVVEASDVDAVEEILEAVDFPDALPVGGDEDDGDDRDDDLVEIDPDEVLGGLFVACDRLARNGRDPEGVLRVAELSAVLADARMPYGYTVGVWDDLRGRATALRARLESTREDDETIEADAGALRELLRGYV